MHMHWFPSNPERRQQWCLALCMEEKDLPADARVCSRHFADGDTSNLPSLTLGKRFASPKKRPVRVRVPLSPKKKQKRAKRSPADNLSLTPSTPSESPVVSESITSMSTVGESECNVPTPSTSNTDEDRRDLQITVNAALMARIEVLEHENASLKRSLEASSKKPFRLEDIAHDDRLVRTYTGFPSYVVLLAFFNFLGPAAHHLQYWGTKESSHSRQKKLNPLNCLFLTLIKLRLNLTEQDLAFRFGISTSTVSRYFITWICFLYNHLKEIEWCPPAEQVACTLPHAFKQKYPTTYIIIDASELLWKHRLTLCYNRPHGVITNSIILLNIL